MARKKYGIIADDFMTIIEKIDKFGGDVKKTAKDMLDVAPKIINPKLHAAMQEHKRTGRTEKGIIENPQIEDNGTVLAIPVGFDIKNDGKTNLASIFLMYGTARHAPANQYGKYSGEVKGVEQDKKLYDAIYGSATKKEIKAAQEKILGEALQAAMKGK